PTTTSTYLNSLTMRGTSTLAVGSGGSLILASGGILAVGANSITGSGIIASEFTTGSAFTPTAYGREVLVHVTAGNTLSVAPVIFGTAGLTKGDGGTLTLGAQNTYVGTTTINGGTLKLGGGLNTI